MKKTNKGIVILLVIFILITIGLLSYIIYDKFISNNTDTTKTTKETNKETKTGNENTKSLSGKTYVTMLDENEKNYQYLKFIDDTNYEFNIENFSGEKYVQNGTYTYDGTTLKINDEKIKVKFYNDMILVNYDNPDTDIDDGASYLYYVYINKDNINKEFENMAKVAAKNRLEKWNSSNDVKMNNTSASVTWCYAYENDSGIACSTTVSQYFDNYSYDTCKNDEASAFFNSIISSGSCESDHSTYWSFYGFEKTNDEYNVIGSGWTGL